MEVEHRGNMEGWNEESGRAIERRTSGHRRSGNGWERRQWKEIRAGCKGRGTVYMEKG